MTCRHAENDPACGGYEGRVASARRLVDEYNERRGLGKTPDAAAFNIKEVAEIGPHLVLKVEYPNCANCAFEGVKIVFLNTRASTALLWREIDPHFRGAKNPIASQAPSPAARFPASAEGWDDAIAYAKSKIVQHVMES
jgi:hypothetical protein